MNSVSEAIAWLEVSRNAHSPSMSHVYATTILGELHRLNDSIDVCSREVEKLERLREEAVNAHRAVESSLGSLEETTRRGREEWDQQRTELETRFADLQEKLRFAEGVLKDVHYGLLKQPELTREDLAKAITSAVTPYREGEKPLFPEKPDEEDPYLWESGT